MRIGGLSKLLLTILGSDAKAVDLRARRHTIEIRLNRHRGAHQTQIAPYELTKDRRAAALVGLAGIRLQHRAQDDRFDTVSAANLGSLLRIQIPRMQAPGIERIGHHIGGMRKLGLDHPAQYGSCLVTSGAGRIGKRQNTDLDLLLSRSFLAFRRLAGLRHRIARARMCSCKQCASEQIRKQQKYGYVSLSLHVGSPFHFTSGWRRVPRPSWRPASET